MSASNKFTDLILNALKEKNMSQVDLANRIGLENKKALLGLYVRVERSVPVDILYKIAKELGIDQQELYGAYIEVAEKKGKKAISCSRVLAGITGVAIGGIIGASITHAFSEKNERISFDDFFSLIKEYKKSNDFTKEEKKKILELLMDD